MAPNIKDFPARFAAAWQSRDAVAFTKLFTPDACMTDHGAQIHIPFAYLEAHHINWNGAHENFQVYVDPSFPIYWADVDEERGNAKISFRTINKGVFKNDLPRRKATGKWFQYSGVIDLVVEGGLVKKADEWLRVPFEDSVAVEQYIVISPETQKKVQAER